MIFRSAACSSSDRKSTRLNSSHTVIYTLSLHDALPICLCSTLITVTVQKSREIGLMKALGANDLQVCCVFLFRSEEHTSELQSHSDLHSFPTRRSSDLPVQYAHHRHRAEIARDRADESARRE